MTVDSARQMGWALTREANEVVSEFGFVDADAPALRAVTYAVSRVFQVRVPTDVAKAVF
jgi:hypothetical protein